jgi:hypothetical protein
MLEGIAIVADKLIGVIVIDKEVSIIGKDIT